MNTPKPKESLAGQTCPSCQKGLFALVQIDYDEPVAEDNPITIPGVWVERCDLCGETVFPGETTRFIESVVADQTEQLTQRELERVREDLGVATQDEMSDALGLGLKTYHKWESGKQYPTRSMSYYIRVLAEFPQAFEWLRRRGWRNQNRLLQQQSDLSQPDLIARFPDLPSCYFLIESKATVPSLTPTPRIPRSRMNPALGLTHAFAAK